MGIHTSLKNERGVMQEPEVLNTSGLLQRLLPPISDQTSQCLRFIDWYGFTIFNRPQMPTFLEEWDRLQIDNLDSADKECWVRIRALAVKCQEGVHLYLWFRGD